MRDKGFLNSVTVVSTVMSNLGFYQALKEHDMESVQAHVGDRYVMEKMREGGFNLGGEQSGHIVFLDYSTCGDGMLSALQLINIMKETDKPLSELAAEMTIYPQILKNIKVAEKNSVLSHPRILDEIDQISKKMGDTSRILVRDRKSTRLNSSHVSISYACICVQYTA